MSRVPPPPAHKEKILYETLPQYVLLGAVNLTGGVFQRSETATPGFQSVNCTGRFSWDTCSRSMDSTGIRCEEAAVVCQGNIWVRTRYCDILSAASTPLRVSPNPTHSLIYSVVKATTKCFMLQLRKLRLNRHKNPCTVRSA